MTHRNFAARIVPAITAAVALAAAASSPAEAQNSFAGQGLSEAVVVSPLSFFKVDDLVFGRIVPGTTAGTVVIAPNGTRTATGGVRLASGVPHQPAAFAGRGSFNQIVTISINATSRTLTRQGGTQTMVMDTFVIGSTPTTTLTTAPLAFRIANANGMFQFPVGARLRVGANQAPGIYAGTFTLTLNYQ